MNQTAALPTQPGPDPASVLSSTAIDPQPPATVAPAAPHPNPNLEPENDPYKSRFCWYRSMSGRRCRQFIYDRNIGLCRKHARVKGALDKDGFIPDVSPFLTANPRHLDDLEGVHSFLSALAVLLAQNRISTRRAAVLSYICTQLIRTNIAIDQRDPDPGPPLAFNSAETLED
jgi:hypothetical protein